MVPPFIVKTNKTPLFGCSALVSIMKPLKPLSWILPSSSRSTKNLKILSTHWSRSCSVHMVDLTHGPSAKAANSRLDTFWQKKKHAFEWTTHHFLCGLAFSADAQHPGQTNIPTHSRGMSYTLLSILRAAPVDGDLILINQDLAGFFTSIDQARFLGAWYMLLDFLRPQICR